MTDYTYFSSNLADHEQRKDIPLYNWNIEGKHKYDEKLLDKFMKDNPYISVLQALMLDGIEEFICPKTFTRWYLKTNYATKVINYTLDNPKKSIGTYNPLNYILHILNDYVEDEIVVEKYHKFLQSNQIEDYNVKTYINNVFSFNPDQIEALLNINPDLYQLININEFYL